MPTHLAAFMQCTHNLALAEINVVQDDILTQASSSRWLVPVDYNAIFAMAALGTGITRAQVNTPSLQVRREILEVVPRAASNQFFSLANPEFDIPNRDIALQATETIAMKMSDAGAADFPHYGLVWFKKPGPIDPMPDGDIRRVRATGTTTLTAQKWTSVTMTLDNDLEPGTYALVGFFAASAGCLASRAIITGQNYRPGMPGFANTEALGVDFDPSMWNDMMYYNMGTFAHTNIPQFQFLSSSADTAEELILFLIRTGAAPGGT